MIHISQITEIRNNLSFRRTCIFAVVGFPPSITRWTACTPLVGIIKSVCLSFFSTTGIWLLHFGGKEFRQLATNNLPGKEDDADGSTVTQVSDGSPAMLAYPVWTMVLRAVTTSGRYYFRHVSFQLYLAQGTCTGSSPPYHSLITMAT